MSESEDHARSRVVNAAVDAGLVWLNHIFKFRDGSIRVFNVRLSGLELVWGTVIALLYIMVAMPLSFLIGDWWILDIALHPIGVIVEGIAVGWVFGRRLAHTSPLRRKTGEGMGVWFRLQLGKANIWLSTKLGQRAYYNTCQSWATGKQMEIGCVEWLGTSRAPRMPRTTDDPDGAELIMPPRTVRRIRKVRR